MFALVLVLILHHLYLLSSACLSFSPVFSLPQAIFWEVRVGEHNQKLTEASEKTYTVSRVFHYPWYRGYDNDMALMKLSQPIEETEYASPVCMPPDANTDFIGNECVATGWGKVDYSEYMRLQLIFCVPGARAFKCLMGGRNSK